MPYFSNYFCSHTLKVQSEAISISKIAGFGGQYPNQSTHAEELHWASWCGAGVHSSGTHRVGCGLSACIQLHCWDSASFRSSPLQKWQQEGWSFNIFLIILSFMYSSRWEFGVFFKLYIRMTLCSIVSVTDKWQSSHFILFWCVC